MMDPHTRMTAARLAMDERRRDAERHRRTVRARRARATRSGTRGHPAGPVAALRQGLAVLAGGRRSGGDRRPAARPTVPETAA